MQSLIKITHQGDTAQADSLKGGPSAKGNDKQPNTGFGSLSKSLQLFCFPLPVTSLSPTCFFLSHKSVQKILLPFWYQFGAIISP